jgi:hypothetical protein
MVKISGATGLIATCIVALPLLELTATVAAPAGISKGICALIWKEEQPEGSPDRYSHRGIVVETADRQMNEGSAQHGRRSRCHHRHPRRNHQVRRRVIGVTAFKILATPARGSNRVFVADWSAEIAGSGATRDILRENQARYRKRAAVGLSGNLRGRPWANLLIRPRIRWLPTLRGCRH